MKKAAKPTPKIKAPDLTQRPPRSPHTQLGGFVILPRLLDKARAALIGRVGEYYDGPKGMNGRFLSFVGLEHADLVAFVATGAGDWEVLQWIQSHAKHPRSEAEIASWSDFQRKRVIDSDAETLEGFAKAMRRIHPDREDIKTRFDFLDLDDYHSFGGHA